MYASHLINTNHVCRTVGDSKAKKRSDNDFGGVKSRFGYLSTSSPFTDINTEKECIFYRLSAYPDIISISQVQSQQYKVSPQSHGQDSQLL